MQLGPRATGQQSTGKGHCGLFSQTLMQLTEDLQQSGKIKLVFQIFEGACMALRSSFITCVYPLAQKITSKGQEPVLFMSILDTRPAKPNLFPVLAGSWWNKEINEHVEWKGNVCFSSLIISYPGICESGFTAVETCRVQTYSWYCRNHHQGLIFMCFPRISSLSCSKIE